MMTWLEQVPQRTRWGIILLAGLLNTFAYAPHNIPFIPFITLTVLLLELSLASHNKAPKAAAISAYLYGLGWFGAGISWIHVSIDQFGGLPIIGSLALMGILIAYLALFPALCAGLLIKYTPSSRYWWLAFPAFWLFSEWLRSELLTGFPWLSLGYTQISTPLAGFAPVIGEVGITFIIGMIAVLLAQLLQRRYIKASIAGLVLIALLSNALHWAQWVRPTGEIKTVALVQGNIKQEMRWAPENDGPTLLKYRDLTRPHYDADLVIWPEAAIPKLEPASSNDLRNIDTALAMNSTALISGIIDYNFESRDIYNTLIVLGLRNENDNKGQYHYPHANRYNKHHLLPIGEFVPFEDLLRPLAPIFDLPMSSFSRGDIKQTNLRANGLNVVPAICFEIIFPRQVRQNITDNSDFILTVSNDAWFGDSAGPFQHLQIAQMRALEFGRPLLRATNNGVTAITDEKGNIIAQLPQFTVGVLKSQVKLVSGLTPYQRFGDWPLGGLSLLGLIILQVIRRREVKSIMA
ncbi:MAG: apolipoprotein N-acyltransferase [Alteromonadaceae bacterium]|jgi:apolipoprotein N-acyltransferase